MIWSESNILYAIVGSVGVIATLIIWLRANSITSKYYKNK